MLFQDAQNHVIPGQLGEFIIKLQSTYVFSVNGFHGNSNLGYLCIQGKAADIYHCGKFLVAIVLTCINLINPFQQGSYQPRPTIHRFGWSTACFQRTSSALSIQRLET